MALSRPKVITPGTAAGGGAAEQGVTASITSGDVQTSSTGSQSLVGSAANGTAPYSYAWTLRTKPSGSGASITSASSSTATLTGIDAEGAYVCSLQVTDDDSFTDTAQCTIDYAPAALSVNAGSDVQTTADTDQSLTGSASGGTGGLSYSWSLVTKPTGSTASITSATSATATLTGIDNGGAYVCKLTVTDSAASAVSASDTVVIDYSASSSDAGWVDVIDLDFTSMSSQALTDGQENTIGSDTFWIDGFAANGAIGITNGTGLEVSFPNQSGNFANFYYKGTGISKLSSGDWPRFRVVAAISNITFSQNSDAIGVEAVGWPATGTTHRVPRITGQLKRNSGSSFVWKFSVRKGSLGSSGSNMSASDVATSEPSSIVLEIRQAAGGVWKFDADESTTTIPDAGSGTARGSALQPHAAASTSIYDYWAEGSNLDGPYLGLTFRSLSNGSQACVVERLVIQKLI